MYRVFWLYSARMQLAEFWVNADSQLRGEITAAAAALDRDLKWHPLSCGESRELNERLHIVGPLVARFTIDAENNEVTVLAVHVYQYRQRG